MLFIVVVNKDPKKSKYSIINTGCIKPIYTTCSHTLNARQQSYSPLSISLTQATLQHYLLYSPNAHSYLSVGVLCFAGPPSIKGTSLSRHVKFGTPLNHVHLDVSRFQILVRTNGFIYTIFSHNSSKA